MFIVLKPQPEADISLWTLKYSDYYQAWGIADPNEQIEEAEFVPLTQGIDPVGIKVVKRNGMWYWARPAYYNVNSPKDQVFGALAPLGIFDEHQMRLIANCVNYQNNDPAGLGCHQVNLLTAKLYILLNLTLNLIDPEEKRGIVEAYRSVTGGE